MQHDSSCDDEVFVITSRKLTVYCMYFAIINNKSVCLTLVTCDDASYAVTQSATALYDSSL